MFCERNARSMTFFIPHVDRAPKARGSGAATPRGDRPSTARTLSESLNTICVCNLVLTAARGPGGINLPMPSSFA